MTATIWSWLGANAAAAAVLTVVSLFITWVLRVIVQELRKIRDLLDTDTPGGLGDLKRELEKQDEGQ